MCQQPNHLAEDVAVVDVAVGILGRFDVVRRSHALAIQHRVDVDKRDRRSHL